MNPAPSGFTLLEIMATILLMAVGIGSVAGLIGIGAKWHERANAGYTAQATALTVAADPWPDRHDLPATQDWSITVQSGSLESALNDYSREIQGKINGWHVIRRETSPAKAHMKPLATVPYADSRIIFVQVDVYASGHSRLVASATNQWIWRP